MPWPYTQRRTRAISGAAQKRMGYNVWHGIQPLPDDSTFNYDRFRESVYARTAQHAAQVREPAA
eukprot:2780228-Pyramimonas_sp.AAC.1